MNSENAENTLSIFLSELSGNPNAVHIIERYIEKGILPDCWENLCLNPNALYIIDKFIRTHINSGSAIDNICKNVFKNKLPLDILEKYSDVFVDRSSHIIARYCYSLSFLEKYLNEFFKFDWDELSANKYAIPILQRNKDKINWKKLSTNENAISFLENNWDKIDWASISENKNAMHLIKKRLRENPESNGIDLKVLSKNQNAIHILKKNIGLIDWEEFVLNENPDAIELISNHLDKLNQKCWGRINANPNAISLLEKYYEDDITRRTKNILLSKNRNAVPLLKKFPELIYWKFIGINPNAIDLIEENLDKIDWSWVAANPNAVHLIEKKLKEIFQ